jgi:hypothetical protein
MSDFNVDFDKLKTAKIENGDIIPMGSDAEYHAEFTMEKVPNFMGTDFTEVPHLRLQAPGNTKAIYHQPVRLEGIPVALQTPSASRANGPRSRPVRASRTA